MCNVIRFRVDLLQQHLAAKSASMPSSRPCFVRPRQAKWETGFARREHLLEWTVEQALAMKPVVPIAEALDAVCRRK